MKKLALVLAVVMVLSLGLTACGGSTSSTGTASSAPAGSSSSGSASDAAPAYNPDALQVKALDDNTLQVTLTARTPYFLELTAFPAYAPVQQATVEANGEAWAVDAATYIGNGPYKIAEWVPSSHITMVKNENYWNVDSLAGPDTLQFTLMEDDAAQLTAFQSGELDFIDAVPNDEIDALSSTPEFYKEGQIGTYYVSYNTQAAPFDDPLVRQAFTLAVDRDYICKQIGKSGQIPDHAAAHGHHQVAAAHVELQHLPKHRFQDLEALAGLALRHRDDGGFPALVGHALGILGRHAAVGDNGHLAVQPGKLVQIFQGAAFYDDIVAALAQVHGQLGSDKSTHFVYTPNSRTVRQVRSSSRSSAAVSPAAASPTSST